MNLPDPRCVPVHLSPNHVTSLQLVRTAALFAISGGCITRTQEERLRVAIADVTAIIRRACGGTEVPQ